MHFSFGQVNTEQTHGALENWQNNNLHRVLLSVRRVLWMSSGCIGVAAWLDLLLLRQQKNLPGRGRCPNHPVSVPAEPSFGKVGCSFWPALYIWLVKTQAAWRSKNSCIKIIYSGSIWNVKLQRSARRKMQAVIVFWFTARNYDSLASMTYSYYTNCGNC